MADNRSLGILGFILAGATVLAIVMAAITVRDHMGAEALAQAGHRVVALAFATTAR